MYLIDKKTDKKTSKQLREKSNANFAIYLHLLFSWKESEPKFHVKERLESEQQNYVWKEWQRERDENEKKDRNRFAKTKPKTKKLLNSIQWLAETMS